MERVRVRASVFACVFVLWLPVVVLLLLLFVSPLVVLPLVYGGCKHDSGVCCLLPFSTYFFIFLKLLLVAR